MTRFARLRDAAANDCYHFVVAQPNLPITDPAKERAERAARIAAMLDRWAAEDTSGEPDWDVDDFERLNLTRAWPEADRATLKKP